MKKIFKPVSGYPAFFQQYLDVIPNDGNLLLHLRNILEETEQLVIDLPEEMLLYRYAEGKWTIKDTLVHVSDCERVLIYRAMRIARGDKTALPGFDEELLAAHANANKRALTDILNELETLRTSNIIFIGTLSDEALDRTGTANGNPVTARLLVNQIYGHHRHHLNIIRERYLA
jgi:uncharacterized damage-inducible protein DinB